MTNPTATFLSDETIASTKASLAALDTLRETIKSTARSNPAINADTGVGALHGFVRGVRNRFANSAEADAEEQMPAAVVELLSTVIVPALADVVAELDQLWANIQEAVAANESGQPLVDTFLADAENDGSALVRLQSGLEKLQQLALEIAVDQLTNALS